MAKIISLDAFRARSVSSKQVQAAQACSAETQACELMTAAANLLLECSPGNLRVAWMLQDLRDLVVTQSSQHEAEIVEDSAQQSNCCRDVLTNLG